MLAHNLLDSLGGLIGVVERNCRHVVVKDVGLNDAMQKGTANESKFTIDRSSGTTSICPSCRIVMGESGIGVLKISDGNYSLLESFL